MKNNKKIKYTTWKEYVYLKRVKFLLIFLIIICLLTISVIPFILRMLSTTENEVSLFVNYADNDVGVDIVPEGLDYNWYLDGVIIESGTIGASGYLTFSIMDLEGVYILELGEDLNYAPSILNYTFVHGVFSDEIEIGTKLLESNLYWGIVSGDFSNPIADQTVELYMRDVGSGLFNILVGSYVTDSLGFVDANVITGTYRWQINSQTPESCGAVYIDLAWWDYTKNVAQYFAPKVVRGIIIMVFLVILEKGGFRITIFIFLTISNK